jgi:hypothetical protein
LNFNFLLKWADLNVWSKFSIYSITYHVFAKTGHEAFKTSNKRNMEGGKVNRSREPCVSVRRTFVCRSPARNTTFEENLCLSITGEKHNLCLSIAGEKHTVVCFSPVIDRQRFSVAIVRELCDVWSNMNAATFVTDEQNALSLCPPEGPANLVVIRIRGLSLRRMEPHTYLRSSAPSDVQSDMYVKDAVLCSARQCEPWSTSLK